MSLLMQALKKAERAKQNSIQESELDKPSEAFDEVLSLEPLAAAPSAAPAADPTAGLSLAPLAETGPAAAPAAARADAGTPAGALAFAADGLPPIPVLNVAAEAIHNPVPPQARHQGGADAAREAAAPSPTGAAAAAATAGEAPRQGDAKAPPRGAARARAATTAAPAPIGIDPARLRVMVLGAIAVLIALVFAYMYWQAVYAPGAGSKLPMVPMPPLNATGATGATIVVAQPGGLAEAQVLADSAPAEPAPAAAEAQRREEQMAQQLAELQARMQQMAQSQAQQPGPETLAPLAAADSGEIRVVRNNVAPQLNPALQGGYQAYNGGDLRGARAQYEQVLQQDPNNRDALLGLAALALRQQQDQQAAAGYARLLELDPNDADAMAGLIGMSQGDPAQSELRLKKLLQGAPESGPALFALGNLYARQGRWPEAQPLFFRAHGAVPANADYAFNLAVALDRLNQPKLALSHYQKALALAQNQPGSFDPAAVHLRLRELAAAPGQAANPAKGGGAAR
ncbi:tetratricopeptide repeat protein [Rugamonas sp. DEMB1]|uniref:tetratricopeptide repeat protein n=1 Tax=Rugamonas sp. DEMB1 TaxID=3039386 RepID=UPI002446896A|nr:tetratricopeptide repeat protein [Rugamonas sp. DEMB1]WGG52671.1 tetratricopeptide repeat protein [Rugamonas sp. DEMB1]